MQLYASMLLFDSILLFFFLGNEIGVLRTLKSMKYFFMNGVLGTTIVSYK